MKHSALLNNCKEEANRAAATAGHSNNVFYGMRILFYITKCMMDAKKIPKHAGELHVFYSYKGCWSTHLLGTSWGASGTSVVRLLHSAPFRLPGAFAAVQSR